MKIDLTKEERDYDLNSGLFATAMLLETSRGAGQEILLASLLTVHRIALWLKTALTESLNAMRATKEEADRVRQQLDKARDDANFFKAERDKLASEIEDWSFRPATPFDRAVASVQRYHAEQLESLPLDEQDGLDPFKHQQMTERFGLGLDAFPLAAIEAMLKSNKMGSYESWRLIAYSALLSMSYLRPLYQGECNEEGYEQPS